jgi:hypothetical protein
LSQVSRRIRVAATATATIGTTAGQRRVLGLASLGSARLGSAMVALDALAAALTTTRRARTQREILATSARTKAWYVT